MITALAIYSVVATLIIIYLLYEPSFELKLVQDGEYNTYILYMYYIKQCDENGIDYGTIKLFSFKRKQKK